MTTPEERAREKIDCQLNEAGWIVQNRDEINLAANDGVIIREFPGGGRCTCCSARAPIGLSLVELWKVEHPSNRFLRFARA